MFSCERCANAFCGSAGGAFTREECVLYTEPTAWTLNLRSQLAAAREEIAKLTKTIEILSPTTTSLLDRAVRVGAEVARLKADLERKEEALRDLVGALRRVHASPLYLAVWTVNQLHAGHYVGPTYTIELARAAAALTPAEKQAPAEEFPGAPITRPAKKTGDDGYTEYPCGCVIRRPKDDDFGPERCGQPGHPATHKPQAPKEEQQGKEGGRG